jgi:hypothetical protein
LTDDENFAAEMLRDENLENVRQSRSREKTHRGRQDLVLLAPECGQLAGLTALAGDETEILESFGKKGPKVLFAIGDAGPWHDLSITKPADRASLLGLNWFMPAPFN